MENSSKLGLAVFILLTPAVSLRAEFAPCQRVTYEHSEYTVCEVDLRRQSIRLFWKNPDGHPYGYPSSLPRALATTRGASFSRQMVACTTRTTPQSACTSRKVGSWYVPTRAQAPVTFT